MSAVSAPLHGLDRYTNYSITVAAYTRRGDGVRPPLTHCITDQDVPGPVEAVKALAVDSQRVLVAWRPPDKPNGVITKYTVHVDQPHTHSHTQVGRVSAWGLAGAHSSGVGLGSMWEVGRGEGVGGGRTWVVSGEKQQHLVARLAPATTFGFYVHASTLVGDGPPGIRITQRPRPHAPAAIASFSEKTIAIWGEELHLACHVVGSPTPTRTWTFNGKGIPHSHVRVKEYPDGSLLVSDVKARDSGNYTCTATNLHGSDAITYAVAVQA